MSEPTLRDLYLAAAWFRENAHREVVRAFKASGLTHAELAKRMHCTERRVRRLMGGSGNWTIDTVGQLLFAIDGSMARVERERHGGKDCPGWIGRE